MDFPFYNHVHYQHYWLNHIIAIIKYITIWVFLSFVSDMMTILLSSRLYERSKINIHAHV